MPHCLHRGDNVDVITHTANAHEFVARDRNITALRACGAFLRRNEDTEALPRNQV
jgi:hypothetical protein